MDNKATMQHPSSDHFEEDLYGSNDWGLGISTSLSNSTLTNDISSIPEPYSWRKEVLCRSARLLGEHPKSKIAKNPPPSLASQIFSPVNLGLLNILRSTPPNQAKRSSSLSNTVRLSMARIYCKFIIQALLYLLATYLLTLCFQLPWTVLVPLTIICALHLAARTMHSTRNSLHRSDAHQNYSLTRDMKWVDKRFHSLIDHSSNFTLGLFSAVPQKIADSRLFGLLDRQMAHIPDNSPRPRRGK